MVTHTLADAWADVLPESHREALYSAFILLADNYFTSDDKQGSMIGEDLPRKYRHRYTPIFLQRFFASLLTVGYKLAQSDPPVPLLSCTAEELACAMTIDLAEAHLDENGIEADYELFEEAIYQDSDFKFLYQPEVDGIEDSPEFSYLGIGQLRFDEWFLPFDNAATAVHPYSAD